MDAAIEDVIATCGVVMPPTAGGDPSGRPGATCAAKDGVRRATVGVTGQRIYRTALVRNYVCKAS